MDEDKVSPIAIVLTFLLHCSFFYLATTNFPHHPIHRSPYDVVHVSIPVGDQFHPHVATAPVVNDVIEPLEQLISKTELEQPVDKDRYYLQQELSQPTRVLFDSTTYLDIPIRRPVIMSIYVNEAGDVDDVTIDDKGVLTSEEQELLIRAFNQFVFMPGMRGEKVVKSIYRIELEVNRKVVLIH